MIYGVYNDLRTSAWKCLLDYKASSLPIDIINIATAAGVKVIKNSNVNILQPSESGATCFDGDQWYIVYDDDNTVTRSRFTVAHELGHIFLGHEMKKGYIPRSKEFVIKPPTEREADLFAARLLCPSCVLWALNLRTTEEIARVCRVSRAAAQIRAGRMEVLMQRNRFLEDPLEREVFNCFEDYIKKTLGEYPGV